MAKKKKRKDDSKKSFEHSAELYGVILILCGILGIGKYGPVGRIIASFGLFLVGTGYGVFLLLLLVIGLYLVIKREWPNFFTTKLLGVYVVVLGILILMHQSYIVKNEGDAVVIFKETLDQLMISFHNIMNGVRPSITGGGVIGGGFAILFDKLFAYQGMQIVSWTLIGLGITLFTGFSILDMVRNTVKKGKELVSHNKKETPKKSSVIINGVDDEEEEEAKGKEDHRIVISSIDELTKINDDSPKQPVSSQSIEQEINESQEEKITLENLPKRKTKYQLPPLSLLDLPKKNKNGNNQAVIEHNIVVLEKVLRDFGVIGKVVEVHMGPTVTQYELELQSGTKVNKLLSIHREISLALAKKDVRIEAPIPGKNTVGIELPNDKTTMVSFREVLEGVPKSKEDSKLLAALGKNIMGAVQWCEVDKTPHLLVAGATGSGKSVCINGIICSILMRAKPDEVKLLMVDPKKVELSVYNGVPHLMAPVVTDPKKASVALGKIVQEMERRYDVFSDTKTKNIKTYNEYIDHKNEGLSEEDKLKRMPYIVVIVDELADLMLVASKEVEDAIMRITQMARAAGIHLIIATQRPSTDVITGVVKANIPSRISFAVSSSIDSRTILDMTGAEKLLGKGDMLFLPMGESSPMRIQGAFISDDEIKRVIDYTVAQQIAEYDESMLNLTSPDGNKSASQREDEMQEEEYDDPLYNEIVEFVISAGKISASLLQRKYRLGYNRAARIIDLLEERGIIGPSNGSKPREVLIKLENDSEE